MLESDLNETDRAGSKRLKRFAGPANSMAFSLRRLIPSYLLCFVPFLVFGTKGDIRLILWKIAVVGAGLLAFHFARKSMFPYIDLRSSYKKVVEADEKSDRLPFALLALAQSILVAVLAFAILLSIAGGI
jgi:hypothetical protein